MEENEDLAILMRGLGGQNLSDSQFADDNVRMRLVEMEELRAESLVELGGGSGSIGRSKGANIASNHQQISVAVVTEFVRWNEEVVSRCNIFSSQSSVLVANVRAVFTCLLDQVSQYLTEGLERAREGLIEAASLRERFVLGTNISRRVATAAASAAEAVAAAGESSFRSFMVVVQRCASSVAVLISIKI